MLALSVKKLKKVYANGLVALKGIDLTVQQGDFFALLGQNGAGKSTTIGILSSLVNKTAGEVVAFDYNLDFDLQNFRDCIGVVPQEMNFSIFETVWQIVMNQAGYYGISTKLASQRAEHYLKKMGLWEKRHQASGQLSGGMKRRLMIARALVIEPKLLILDEPTAGVDIELRHDLWRFLTEINKQGTTIILTTHYLEEAEHLCKHVAIIDQGEIIESANMKVLINRLHAQTIILDLAQPLTVLPDIKDFSVKLLDESTLEVIVYKDQMFNDLFNLLNQLKINIAGMRNKTNRLEELFVNLIRENKAAS